MGLTSLGFGVDVCCDSWRVLRTFNDMEEHGRHCKSWKYIIGNVIVVVMSIAKALSLSRLFFSSLGHGRSRSDATVGEESDSARGVTACQRRTNPWRIPTATPSVRLAAPRFPTIQSTWHL